MSACSCSAAILPANWLALVPAWPVSKLLVVTPATRKKSLLPEPGASERLKGRASDSASVWVAVTAASTLNTSRTANFERLRAETGRAVTSSPDAAKFKALGKSPRVVTCGPATTGHDPTVTEGQEASGLAGD